MLASYARPSLAPTHGPCVDPADTAHARPHQLLASATEEITLAGFWQKLASIDAGDAALDEALRFLSGRFLGAILFAADQRAIVAVRGCGRIHDWHGLRRLVLRKTDRCLIAQMCRSFAIHFDRPSVRPIDALLARLATGDAREPALAISLGRGSRVEHVLYAFTAFDGGGHAHEGMQYQSFQRALMLTLARMPGTSFAELASFV
jgi:hypothetical protein